MSPVPRLSLYLALVKAEPIQDRLLNAYQANLAPQRDYTKTMANLQNIQRELSGLPQRDPPDVHTRGDNPNTGTIIAIVLSVLIVCVLAGASKDLISRHKEYRRQGQKQAERSPV